MTTFDAERYLRVAGERELLAAEQNAPGESPLEISARAFAAVGVIEQELADRVVADYARALGLRGRHHFPGQHTGSRPAAAPIEPPRVSLCNHTIDMPWGTMRIAFAALARNRIRLAVTMTVSGRASRSSRRAGRFMHHSPFGGGGPPSLTITDDRGTSATAHFSGGGGDTEYQGEFTADADWADDTAWIEVQGERIDLGAGARDVHVDVEPVGPGDPARLYLQRALQTASRHGSVDIEQIVGALVDCGALAAGDPVIDESRAVAEALSPFGWAGPTPTPPPTAPGASLPEPWRSLIASRNRGGGPDLTLPVGVATPVFDGVSLAVIALESSADGFEIKMETIGAVDVSFTAGGIAAVQLTFTATDDLGGRYLGGLGDWHGDENGMSATVGYWPALDPRARRLDLEFNGPRTRAVVRVPLGSDQAR